MSYLARLKKLEKPLLRVPTKLTKAPSVSSVSDPSRRISEKTAVYQYQLSDRPGVWLVLIARPGTDLDRARRRLAYQFGSDRVTAVRPHQPRKCK